MLLIPLILLLIYPDVKWLYWAFFVLSFIGLIKNCLVYGEPTKHPAFLTIRKKYLTQQEAIRDILFYISIGNLFRVFLFAYFANQYMVKFL